MNTIHASTRVVDSAIPQGCPAACPFLATAEDPDTALAFPSSANTCNRYGTPSMVTLAQQESLCLSAEFRHCARYQTDSPDDPMADSAPRATATWSQRLARTALLIAIVAFLLAGVIAFLPSLQTMSNSGAVRAFTHPSVFFQPDPTPTLVAPAE